jgi:heat shock protein HspQ
VLDRPVSLGTRLAVNDHVMQLADVTPANLVMRAAVDEEDKTKLVIGQAVHMTLYAFENVVLMGKVDRVYDKAESDRRTFEVDVRVDPASPQFSLLAPGMTGELAFVVSQKETATVVPAQAWQDGALWTVRDGKLARMDATIGLRSVERLEVVSGVAGGEHVVISPIGGMSEGQAVREKMTDPTTAANLNTPKVQKAFKGL